MLTSFAMANVKVAVRVRPLSKKEEESEASFILDVNENVLSIINLKVEGPATEGDRHRQRVRHFTFDYCYLSADKSRPDYASQELVYQDLGTEILDASFAGYNACLFAYGQTGSGKTYTMMGSKDEVGLIPRICDGLCSRVDDFAEDITCQIEVSYLEIYNERVRDLLAPDDLSQYTLKVREHPKDGPYVQDLSKHLVGDHISVRELIERGNVNRTTAATHMHDASSRSHAIFTINFTQATLKDNMPSEVLSKINLVDLAGSERADPNYSKGRLTEGANINKSLVTLGNCISALGSSELMKASNSLSAASIESLAMAEENYTASGLPRKPGYIPYRNSVLTWLLKDSLGGNSKTIMVSTVSPSSTYFNETMSTLRYARRAKHIVNKPMVNEDQNVRLIRELRAEIDSLKALLSCASLSSSQASLFQDKNINDILHENEQKVDRLTEAWVEKWREAASIMQECNVGIRRENVGVIVESDLPHLLGMDDDLLSTGIILYHLKEGNTTIGREDADEEQDIVLYGPGIEPKHSLIQNNGGTVTLCPCEGAICAVNGVDINQPTQLTQGAVVLFGKTNMYRFNHPAEAAKLRERRASIQSNPERKVTRKNSITLKVSSSALQEESRQRSMSFSFTRDGDLIEGQNFNADSALSPIMMYNSGLGLERQHKLEVEKLDETRKKLAELQEKQRVAEEEHQEREEKMQKIYQSHQEMIERQRKLLERLRSEHAKAKQDAEKELKQLREMILEEKLKGEQKLTEELQILKDELTRKAMTSAVDACVLPKVVAMDSETSKYLTELDVDRKRVTQLELLYRQSQKLAAAELHEKERNIERERNEESQAIARAETKLADIENITFPWQRFSSGNSLESLVEETGSYSGESYCSNLDRVSPIGGRSDSDSNSGSIPNTTTNNYNNNNNRNTQAVKKSLTPCGSKLVNKKNNSDKNFQCNKKQESKPVPERIVRTQVKKQLPLETNKRTIKRSDKQTPNKLKATNLEVKTGDARKTSPARLKSSPHDRSPSPPKKTVKIKKCKPETRVETTHGRLNDCSRDLKTDSPRDYKASRKNNVFSRLYQPQAPKFQYLKKKDRPLYGRDWIEPPDRSHDYHMSQVRKGLLTSARIPSPGRANFSQSPERTTPEVNVVSSKFNSSPRILEGVQTHKKSVPTSNKQGTSPRVSSNNPISPRNKHSKSSPDLRKIVREKSPSLNSVSTEPNNEPSKQPSTPSNILHSSKNQEDIKPTKKNQRKKVIVSPPEKVCVDFVKPKITKPKEKTPLSMTPRKKKHSESFYVPMKDKLSKSIAVPINPDCHEYIEKERQPAIGCSKSMEDVSLCQRFSYSDGNVDVVEEYVPSENSSEVDEFPDSLDETEQIVGNQDAKLEAISLDCREHLDDKNVKFPTTNAIESGISCDSLDDEVDDSTGCKNNLEFLDDNNMDIPREIDATLLNIKPIEELEDNISNIESISLNLVKADDLKRKCSEHAFKHSGGSESDDESTNEKASPAKKLRKRQKKSRRPDTTCLTSDSDSEDINRANINDLLKIKIEIRDENDAVHEPLDNLRRMSESSSGSSSKKSDNDDNSDLEGSLNLSGVGGQLSDSFNCDVQATKDGLSSEEIPSVAEDNPILEPLKKNISDKNLNRENNDNNEEINSMQFQGSIEYNKKKENEQICEEQFTEDSDSDSSSEESTEGADYYINTGIQVDRPLSDIKEEVNSSEGKHTDDSSQSTDTYSSPFSSAEEESSNDNNTYNVYEKNKEAQCKQCSSTEGSESLISDDNVSSNESSSDEDNCNIRHSSTEPKQPEHHPYVGDKGQNVEGTGDQNGVHTDAMPDTEVDTPDYIVNCNVENEQNKDSDSDNDKSSDSNQSSSGSSEEKDDMTLDTNNLNSHSNFILPDNENDMSTEKQLMKEVENVDQEKTKATVNAFEKAPNLHKQLLQVGLQNSSTECESADELPCTEYRLVGQNYAIANAQLKMISLLLGTKSTIYSSDESNSPERVESPHRVPSPPKNTSKVSHIPKDNPLMEETVYDNSAAGGMTEMVVQAETLKAEDLPQNLPLISTFDVSQSPVASHVVPVEHDLGDVMSTQTDVIDSVIPNSEQDIELQKSIPDFVEWDGSESAFRTRFPPDGIVDDMYSESLKKASKIVTFEMETQTETQTNLKVLPTSIDKMYVPEGELRSSDCSDTNWNGAQTETITPDKANTTPISDGSLGLSVEVQTDAIIQECSNEPSNCNSDKINNSESRLKETVVPSKSDQPYMVSVSTLTTADDFSNNKGIDSKSTFTEADFYTQQYSASQDSNDILNSPEEICGNEDVLKESIMKNAGTQYNVKIDSYVILDEVDSHLHEDCVSVQQSADSGYEKEYDVKNDEKLLIKTVAASTQTDVVRRKSAVCQTEFLVDSDHNVKTISMGIQTEYYEEENEVIIAHDDDTVNYLSDELYSQTPTYSDSGVQVNIADGMKDFVSEGTSCLDINISDNESSSLIDQGSQTEPLVEDSADIDSQYNEFNSTQSELEELNPDELEDTSDFHPFDDSIEGDSEESPVKSQDTSGENDDLQFLERIKEMQDKAQHIVSRAQMFTSKLRLSNMNDSLDSLEHSPFDIDNESNKCVDTEEGIPKAEIEDNVSEEGSHDTDNKISKLNSIRLNTSSKQIVYSQIPALTINYIKPSENTLSDEGSALIPPLKTNIEASTTQSEESGISDIDQFSNGDDEIDSKCDVTSELLIKAALPQNVDSSPAVEEGFKKMSDTQDIQKSTDNPGIMEVNVSEDEETAELDFARFKLMICEQYVQQKMVLSEVKSFYQQLKEEEEELNSVPTKNNLKLEGSCKIPNNKGSPENVEKDTNIDDLKEFIDHLYPERKDENGIVNVIPVDETSVCDPVNEPELAFDQIDTHKKAINTLKDKLQKLPPPLENNDICSSNGGGTKLVPLDANFKDLTNGSVTDSRSLLEHPDSHDNVKEIVNVSEVDGNDEAQDTFTKAGDHFNLQDDIQPSFYPHRIRFLGIVDKQVVDLPTYGVNFDLDESDEDLLALRKSHEDVERILEETSSPDSDLEDSAIEPELVALMDEIEKDYVDMAKRRLDPPILTEDQLSNNALRIPVYYNSHDTEADGQCLDPQNMRINLKPFSPVRSDWLKEGVLENRPYKNDIYSMKNGKYSVTEPFQIDGINSVKAEEEKSDVLTDTERSGIPMKSFPSSSFSNSPYESERSTPKPVETSGNQGQSSLTIDNVQAIDAFPRKFLSKSLLPLEPSTAIEILSDIQDEIPNGDESRKASKSLKDEEKTRYFPSEFSDKMSNVLPESHKIPSEHTDHRPSKNTTDVLTEIPMDSSTQTDNPCDNIFDLQDESTEVDQALNKPDSNHLHISITSPGNMLDRHDTSVELMEARVMHGIGETDAWLRFLESDNSVNDWMWFKNPNYSLSNGQKENGQRPHTSNGYYSLPVQKTNHLRSNSANSGRDHSPIGRSRQPSRQLEYLQKLRQDVVKATSQTETASENSGIDELLAEYQRTREQSQVEISKAKEKLKQQTRKEKQRLQEEMKYLRDIESLTAEARVRAEDHIRDERKRIFLEERQLLRIKDWSHRRTSSEQDADFASNPRKNSDYGFNGRHTDLVRQSRLSRTWHGTEKPLPNNYVTSVHRQSFSPDRSSVASNGSGCSYSPASTDRSHTASSISVGSDHYNARSPVSDSKSGSPNFPRRTHYDFYHSSFSTDDEVSPRFSYKLSHSSASFQPDGISSNSELKDAKIKMMADPMLVEARYKESLERIKRYEKSRNCFHGHRGNDRNRRRGRSREHASQRRSQTFTTTQENSQPPDRSYRNYPPGGTNSYREYTAHTPSVATAGDSEWEC